LNTATVTVQMIWSERSQTCECVCVRTGICMASPG